MSDYDHSDALRFRAEADRWQQRALSAEAERDVLAARLAEYADEPTTAMWIDQNERAVTLVEKIAAERDALKAQWASVPWAALNDAFGNFFGEVWADAGDPVDVIEKWLDAHAPQEKFRA